MNESSVFDPNESSTLLAKEQWEVIKLRRTLDAELEEFRKKQSKRVSSINAKANDQARDIHEKIFFTMRWAHPKLSMAYQQLVLEYCDHLTGPEPEEDFPKMSFLNAWLHKMKGTPSEKVMMDIAKLYERLHKTLTNRNSSILMTNLHTAEKTEKLTVKKEGSIAWKVHHTLSTRDNYWTIWYLAKNNKLTELLRYLESDESLDVDAIDPDHGFSALHYACMKNHFDIALVLLQAGANERLPSVGDGRTPLHFAAAFGSRELVLELLACGADENCTDHFNVTPLQLARQNKNLPVVRTLENWNFLVPEDNNCKDDTFMGIDETPEELIATSEEIIVNMTRPLQVITRRLEAAADIAIIVLANINPEKSIYLYNYQQSSGSTDGKKPQANLSDPSILDGTSSIQVDENSDDRRRGHHSDAIATEEETATAAAVLLEIRLCEKHAYMCLHEKFHAEAIKSLRRRWRAAKLYLKAIDDVIRYMHLHPELTFRNANVTMPVVSFRYGVEMAMEAVELCLTHAKHEWAEMILSECLMLRDFRFKTDYSIPPLVSEVANPSMSFQQNQASVSMYVNDDGIVVPTALPSGDITALKRRVLLRHCEVLLFMHDTVTPHALQGPSDWLDRRAAHETFLLDFLQECQDVQANINSLMHEFAGIQVQASEVELPGKGTSDSVNLAIELGKSEYRIGETSSKQKHWTTDHEERGVQTKPTAPTNSNSVNSNIMEPIIESFMMEDNMNSRPPRNEFGGLILEPSANPFVTMERFKRATSMICISNAMEVLRTQSENEVDLSFLWESSTLAPALELLAEALDRKGYVLRARSHLDRASVIYERALGPFAADTVRCMIESVRLGLRCLMGGKWGAGYSDPSQSNQNSSVLSSIDITKQPSAVNHGSNKQSNLMKVKSNNGMGDYQLTTSYITSTIMSMREQENKSVYSHNNGANFSKMADNAHALPSVASYHYHNLAKNVERSNVTVLESLSAFGTDGQADEGEQMALSEEERRAETLHVNQAAIDVSRRLDKLALTDPESADKYARRCSNLIAMAELLASEARRAQAAIRRAEKEGRWVIQKKSRLPQALSDIVRSRRSKRVNEMAPSIDAIDENPSHFSSNEIDRGRESTQLYHTHEQEDSSKRSLSAPNLSNAANGDISFTKKSKSVRLLDDHLPSHQTLSTVLSLGSEKTESHYQDPHADPSSNTSKIPATRSIMKKSLQAPATAPSGVDLKRNNAHSRKPKASIVKLTSDEEFAVLKLPKFSKNSFSAALDPKYGRQSGDWAKSFDEASGPTLGRE